MSECFIWGFFVLLIYCVLITKSYLTFKKNRTSFDFIFWIGSNNAWDSPRGRSLFEVIYEKEADLQLPKQYCVLDADRDNANIILNKFQKDIVDMYLNKKLGIKNPNQNFPDEDIGLLYLSLYLEEHSCDCVFENQTMYNQISIKYLDEPDCRSSESINELTEFGLVFTKLAYVSTEYCFRNNKIREHFNIKSADYLKDEIDTKQLIISRFAGVL